MYIVPILAAVLAVVLFAASRTVKKDVERLQTWMRSESDVRSQKLEVERRSSVAELRVGADPRVRLELKSDV